jgi:glycosyltransferase involved in cell wall biosynthesis
MIVHILANDSSGGTQARTLGHVRVLGADSLRQAVVFCATPSERSTLRERLAVAGADVHYLPFDEGRLRFAFALFRLCRRERVAAVMTHGLGFHLVVALAARLAGVQRVITMVGNPVAPDRDRLGSLRRRSRAAAPLVHAVIACSDHVAATLVQHVGLRSDVVRTLANPLEVVDIERRAQGSRAARQGGPAPVICMVARLDPIKDHETVIRAVARLVERRRPVFLRLVGTGPTEPGLRELAVELDVTDAVEFLGNRSDIPEILGGSDLFVFGMTWHEGFGVAVAEAMAARVPIVCTDAGPASEVLDAGRAGLLVPAGDGAAMADAIERLLDEPDTAAKLVEHASAVATERHDIGRLREELREVLGL